MNPIFLPGSKILTGDTPPSPNIGKNGDLYIDASTNAYYTKICGVWEYQGTLTTVLEYWTESNNEELPPNPQTGTYSRFTPKNTDSAIISPNNDGYLSAQVPDGTAIGGNKRGRYAVDFQRVRATNTQVASGDFSFIGSGFNNAASGTNSTVGGGQGNTASNNFSNVSGGARNTASGASSTAGGGEDNRASSGTSTVSGGGRNTASGGGSTVSGGGDNAASATHSTVGGGVRNTASNIYSTTGGGADNNATGISATVGGGAFNNASGDNSTVSGGIRNTASGDNSIVSGGDGNTAFGLHSNAHGYRTLASGSASSSFGFSDTSGAIEAGGTACIVNGRCPAGTMRATGVGSLTCGYSRLGTDVTLNAGDGSLSIGKNLSIPATNDCSILLGFNGNAFTNKTFPVVPPTTTISGIGSLQIAAGNDGTTSNTSNICVVIGHTSTGPSGSGGGVANFWSNDGADYAEFFEWEDGNANNVDRIGYFVTFSSKDPKKIVIANDNSNILGIVSSIDGTAGVIGNSAYLSWSKTAITDKFGRKLYKLSFAMSYRKIFSHDNIVISNEIDEIINKSISDIISYQNNNINISELSDKFIEPFKNIAFTKKVINHNISEVPNTADSNVKLPLVIFQPTFNEEIVPLSTQEKDDLLNKLKEAVPGRVTVANPDYDSTKDYIPRVARKEWTPVGLLGKMYVRDNGKCVPGEKCDCENGIAVPGNKWYVLERTDSDIINIFLK